MLPPASGQIVAVRWRDGALPRSTVVPVGSCNVGQDAISGASCLGSGSWRARTLPASSQRVICRSRSWATKASYTVRAILSRLSLASRRVKGRYTAMGRQQSQQGARHLRGGGQAPPEDQANHPPAEARAAAMKSNNNFEDPGGG
jgi:hypothetical protein